MVAAHFADQRLDIGRDPARAGMRATRLIGQSLQATGLIPFTPRRDRLPRDAVPFGYLTNGCAVVDFSDSAQTDLDRDTCRNIGIRFRNLWIDHRQTVAGTGYPSTMSR
ncbi:Uncharacterised protein [Mycolicibacterium gilvum]|uniref:Uncharacterized protein n=1 Tax=Mycolicibacterium gilvum TaxID=1804 RepID=A0A378SWC0_9MYCO|nr:Uncharacterised protein [Mycolicibacterium gilvum]